MSESETTPESPAAATPETGPVGDGDHVIRAGECVLSLAFDAGHFWEKVWNHPTNAELKSVREYPELVLVGDRVLVPPIEPGVETRGTEALHRFRRKGAPAKVRLRFLEEELPENEEISGQKEANPQDLHASSEDPDPPAEREEKPRANVPYVLVIDGESTEGTTDANGEIEFVIPPNARSGKVVLDPGTDDEVTYPLRLGRLDPMTEPSGVAQRLANLGFDAEESADWEKLEGALASFQERHELEVTGDADDATRAKLEELHGS